ncbi:GNAT family N-acetyltransferase [Solibacillus sp. FSL H8-0538]|uniref:GNAT family N-acetyltransferase n=1 Tax=Solibacillus sp. FSL H8-0538 TaxID=2921400 RepID=UPI0030FBD634
MRIRYATIEERALLLELMHDAFSEYKNDPIPSSALQETVQDIINAAEIGEQALIIENDENLAVGMVRYLFIGDSLYFHRLSVRKTEQAKGYAKKLLIELEHEAISHGKHYIKCRVRANSSKNMVLYINFGYMQYGEQWVEKVDQQKVLNALLEKPLVVAQTKKYRD